MVGEEESSEKRGKIVTRRRHETFTDVEAAIEAASCSEVEGGVASGDMLSDVDGVVRPAAAIA